MNREDFDILNNGIIYLDNAATTQKPRSVVSEIVDYYTKYTANAHRGDYDISLKVDEKYDGVREKVRDFINAETSKEIIFTKGSTESFNMIIFGFMANYLKPNDRVLLTKGEHASNILPWLTLSKKIGFTIDYIDLEDDYSVSIEKVKEKIYENTKVISIAHISNSKELQNAFINDEDIHSRVAADINGIDIKDVSKEQRAAAKAVIFGIVYGISGFGLGESLSISPAKAKEFIDKYYEI